MKAKGNIFLGRFFSNYEILFKGCKYWKILISTFKESIVHVLF